MYDLKLGNLPYPKKQILLNINKLGHNFYIRSYEKLFSYDFEITNIIKYIRIHFNKIFHVWLKIILKNRYAVAFLRNLVHISRMWKIAKSLICEPIYLKQFWSTNINLLCVLKKFWIQLISGFGLILCL